MTSKDKTAYSMLDRPEILAAIFHPRAETSFGTSTTSGEDHLIEVASDTAIGARFHIASPSGPNILYFHGNGEIVADYDELAPMYNAMGINFLVVDYRGYGRSSGHPTVGGMMTDCHIAYDYAGNWLQENGYTGSMVVMGRSLGSASALELAAAPDKGIDGLIIESGFAYAEPLLRLLGVDTDRIGFKEDQGFGNVDKIEQFQGPTLVIHAEYDHIIPFSDGEALFAASGAEQKQFLKIEGANHNDIFFRGMKIYLETVRDFTQSITA